VWVAGCEWQQVHGANDESTVAMGGSGRAVVGAAAGGGAQVQRMCM
jgi:hypothetical protein